MTDKIDYQNAISTYSLCPRTTKLYEKALFNIKRGRIKALMQSYPKYFGVESAGDPIADYKLFAPEVVCQTLIRKEWNALKRRDDFQENLDVLRFNFNEWNFRFTRCYELLLTVRTKLLLDEYIGTSRFDYEYESQRLETYRYRYVLNNGSLVKRKWGDFLNDWIRSVHED